MFPPSPDASPESAASAFFIGGIALRAMHNFPMGGVFECVQAEAANDAVGQGFAFRPGVQGPGNDGAQDHERARTSEDKQDEFSDREFHRRVTGIDWRSSPRPKSSGRAWHLP
jgi:hypothetical protein